MWWNKYLILQCIAFCVLQFIQSVHSQEFITPEELFASLRNDDNTVKSEELSSNLFEPLSSTTMASDNPSIINSHVSSTTTAPQNRSATSSPAPISIDIKTGSNFYKKTDILEEKTTAKAKNYNADGTETDLTSGPTMESKSILENLDINDILKESGINIPDINKSFPEASDAFKDFDINFGREAYDNNPFLSNSNKNFNTPPRPSWIQTSSNRNNFDSTPLMPHFNTNLNSPQGQTWTRMYSSRNTFDRSPFMPNFDNNFDSPPRQTWTRTSSGRNNFDNNPFLENFNINLNTPTSQSWTRTFSSRNNFDDNPFLENFNINLNTPTRQSWTRTTSGRNNFDNFPAGFNTDDNFFDKTFGDTVPSDAFGLSRSHSSGYRTVKTTDDNGQIVERTVRW